MINKTLDFSNLQRPSIKLIMLDDDKTVINVGVPSEDLVSELTELAPGLKAAAESGDENSIDAVYDLAARLMSSNHEKITVTAADLRDKYKITLEYLVIFFNAYLDFIAEITQAKN